MDTDIIDISDTEEEIFVPRERFDDRLSVLPADFTDAIETYHLSKTVKLEKISEEMTDTKETLLEYSDNENYDDSFVANDLIEYGDLEEVQSKSPQLDVDDDDDDIVFIEVIPPNNDCSDTSQKRYFIIPEDQIKKEDIDPESTEMCPISEPTISPPEHKENDDAESAFCIISDVFTTPEENLNSPPKSPIIEKCVSAPQPLEDSSNSDICLIGLVNTVNPQKNVDTSLKSPVKESMSSPQHTEIDNNDFCLISPVSKERHNLEPLTKSPITEESPPSLQHYEINGDGISTNDICHINSKDLEMNVQDWELPPNLTAIGDNPEAHKNDVTENANIKIDFIAHISSSKGENLKSLSSQVHKDDANIEICLEGTKDIVEEVDTLESPSTSLIIDESCFPPELQEDDELGSWNDVENLNTSEECDSIIPGGQIEKEDIEQVAEDPVSTVTGSLKSLVSETIISSPKHKEIDAESGINAVSTMLEENLNSPSKSPLIEECIFSPQPIEDSSNSDLVDTENNLDSPSKSALKEGSSLSQHTENDDAEGGSFIISSVFTMPEENVNSLPKSPLIEECTFSPQVEDGSNSDIRSLNPQDSLDSSSKSPLKEGNSLSQDTENDDDESASFIISSVFTMPEENFNSLPKSPVIEECIFSPQDIKDGSNSNKCRISSLNPQENLDSSSKLEEGNSSQQDTENDDARSATTPEENLNYLPKSPLKEGISTPQHTKNDNNDLKFPSKSPVIEDNPSSSRVHKNDAAENANIEISLESSKDIVEEVDSLESPSTSLIIDEIRISPEPQEDDEVDSPNNVNRIISSLDIEEEVKNVEFLPKSSVPDDSPFQPLEEDEFEDSLDNIGNLECSLKSPIIENSPSLIQDKNGAESSNSDISFSSSRETQDETLDGSNIATSFVDEDTLVSPKENDKNMSQQIAISTVKEHILRLDCTESSQVAERFIEERSKLLAPLKESGQNETEVDLECSKENCEDNSSKSATSFAEKKSVLLESTKENSDDEGVKKCGRLIEEIALLVKSNTFSLADEDAALLESSEGSREQSLKTATSVVKDIPKDKCKDESPNNAINLAEKSLLSETLSENGHDENSQIATSLGEEELLESDEDDILENVTSLVDEDAAHLESSEENVRCGSPGNTVISLDEDSLLLESLKDNDKNDTSFAKEDSLFSEPLEKNVSAESSKNGAIEHGQDISSKLAASFEDENAVLMESSKEISDDDSFKTATSSIKEGSLIWEFAKENVEEGSSKSTKGLLGEDSSLLETSPKKGGNESPKNFKCLQVESSTESSKDESKEIAPRDEETLLMEDPAEKDDENNEASSPKNATNCLKEDSLVSEPPEENGEDSSEVESTKIATSVVAEKDASLLDTSSIKSAEEEQPKETTLTVETSNNSDTLVKDRPVLDSNNVASTSAITNDKSPDVQVNNDEDNEPVTTSEEVRNNIRMQLTNLRKGKNKFPFFKALQQNKNLIDKGSEKVNEKSFFKPQIATVPTVKQPETVKPAEIKNVSDAQEDDNVSNALSELRKIINKPKPGASKEVDTNTKGTEKEDESEKSTNKSVVNKVPPRPTNVSYTVTEIRKIIGTLNTRRNTDIEEPNPDDKSNDKPDSEVNENSNPFVSNSLDEFLTHAKLNVSYDIPKSAAEAGIRKDYAVDPVMLVNPQPVKEEEKDDKDSKKIKKGIEYKPKTLAEKRRILEQNKKRLKNVKVKEEMDTRSYVMFKNKKVFLHSKYKSKCLAYVKSDIPKTPVQTITINNKKPSLLKELYRKASPVKYRPGPLSKKHTLQSDYSQWTTELKPLPKVTLSIIPQFLKPVHPNLISIVKNQWDAEVSEAQIEFALTAVKTDVPLKNIFVFNLKYENNQETLLVRKKIPDDEPQCKIVVSGTNDLVNHEDDDKVVAQVMENLINYVEIKELAPTLIQDDEDFNKEDPDVLKEKAIKRGKIKKRNFNKTNRELLRLNCKVVTMEEDENISEGECFKPYCRLGCVCSSLKSDHIIGIGKHCQKAKCIFECTCPKRASKFLTTDTVTKIEDMSKKYLAKEEKEFTQTVIYTNDKTFVVGMSAKPRRAAKTPKKYSDFFDEDVREEKSGHVKKLQLAPCIVEMDRLDLSGVVPYCLAHLLYNCHCKGTSDLIIENKKRKSTSHSEDVKDEYRTISGRKVRKKSLHHKYVYEEEEQLVDVPNSRTNPIAKRYIKDRKPINTDTIFENDFVNNITQSDRLRAHTKADTDPDFLMGNDALKHYIIEERKLHVRGHQRKQEHTLRQDRHCVSAKKDTIKLVKKVPPKQLKRQSAEPVETAAETSKSYPLYGKRLKILEPQSVSSSIPQPSQSPQTSTSILRSKVVPVFKGEIICNDTDKLKKICNNTQQPADSYARILPWPALLEGFILEEINVYCVCDAPLRLILTKNSMLSDSKFVDVRTQGEFILRAKLTGKRPEVLRQSEMVRDIIKWLRTGNIHAKYSTSRLSFLLVETQPNLFEVRGCCTQTPVKPTLPETNIEAKKITQTIVTENNDTEASPSPSEEGTPDLTEIKHKNMYNQVMSLFITKNKFKSRELIEDGCDDDLSDSLYMWVELPEVCKVAKWRVIFLKNDFMYLYFKSVKYSIKYTDIVKLTEIAKDFNSTLMVRNLTIRRSHGHPLYGLHFSPKYLDRFFVGPYFIDYNGEDVDTLVYKDQTLVSSSELRSGENSDRCGAWMYERGENKAAVIVDLTEDDNPSSAVASCSSSSPPLAPEANCLSDDLMPNQIMIHNGLPIKVLNSKPRSPSEFNRFIVTNIPHFGYLGAYQPERSQVLEVSWPFEQKVLRFENADLARDFLQERFNQVLQPIPETFKIQVIVLLNLDLTENKPINSKYLAGNCICGIFGTLNIHEVSEEYCQTKLNMSRKDITRLFYNKARSYTRQKMSELAKLNSINYTKGVGMDLVFKKTKEEINLQRQTLLKTKGDVESLEGKVKANLKKLYALIKDLTTKERNLEIRVLNETINIRPRGLEVVSAPSVIEIVDDDDDVNMPSTSRVNTVSPPSMATLYPITITLRKPTQKSDQPKNVVAANEPSADVVWID